MSVANKWSTRKPLPIRRFHSRLVDPSAYKTEVISLRSAFTKTGDSTHCLERKPMATLEMLTALINTACSEVNKRIQRDTALALGEFQTRGHRNRQGQIVDRQQSDRGEPSAGTGKQQVVGQQQVEGPTRTDKVGARLSACCYTLFIKKNIPPKIDHGACAL